MTFTRAVAKAAALGFDLAGVCLPGPTRYAREVADWFAAGNDADMHWLRRQQAERLDSRNFLPGCRAIVCVALSYNHPSHREVTAPGRIARFALGEDYHRIFKRLLHRLADWMREQDPGSVTRCSVDISPLFEKEAAQAAGLGWIGKNACLINPRLGSWILLGAVATTSELAPSEPGRQGSCGDCTRCIDACPAGAIISPGTVDSRRCLSYLTIERPAEQALPTGSTDPWLFGCDACQSCCPHNQAAAAATCGDFASRFAGGGLSPAEVLQWDDATYRDRTRHTALRRTPLVVLKATAAALRPRGNPSA